MVGLDFHTGGVGIRISPGQLAADFWDEIPRTFGQSLFINMIALSLPRRPSGVVLITHQRKALRRGVQEVWAVWTEGLLLVQSAMRGHALGAVSKLQ